MQAAPFSCLEILNLGGRISEPENRFPLFLEILLENFVLVEERVAGEQRSENEILVGFFPSVNTKLL